MSDKSRFWISRRRYKVGEKVPVFMDGELKTVTVAHVQEDCGGQLVSLEGQYICWTNDALESQERGRATLLREAERIAAEMVARRKP